MKVRTLALLALLMPLLAELSCSGSTSNPTPIGVLISGSWAGADIFITCTGGEDFRTCGRLEGQIGKVSLVMSQTGDSITGTLTVDVLAPGSTNNAFLSTAVIPVAGTVTRNGTLGLTGAAVIDQTRYGVETVTITTWTATASDTTTSGQFQATISGYGAFGFPQTFRISAGVQLTRQG